MFNNIFKLFFFVKLMIGDKFFFILRWFKSFKEALYLRKELSDFFKTSMALKVISSKFPIGVETMYKVFNWTVSFYMKKNLLI